MKMVGLRRHSLGKKNTPAFIEMILCRLRAERCNLGFMPIRQSLTLEINKSKATLRCFMLFSFHSKSCSGLSKASSLAVVIDLVNATVSLQV